MTKMVTCTTNNDPAARPTRRTFSTEEKLTILARYEAGEPGTKGEFARRKGVYSSQLTEWRRASDAGTLGAMPRRSRGEDRENENSPDHSALARCTGTLKYSRQKI